MAAFMAHNVSMKQWEKSASELGNLEAVRELFDNMIFVGNELNASVGHIYFRDTDLGKDPKTGISVGTVPLLTLKDTGRGMCERTWIQRASRICRAADSEVGYTPDLAQTLSTFGVGINSAAPPLADDIYVFVCHDSGSARERFIVRMGKTLNQAVFDENNGREGYTEQLGYAMLSLPAEFEYDRGAKLSAFKQLQAAIPDSDEKEYTKQMQNATQPKRGDLVPHEVDGVRDILDTESGKTLRAYLGQTYLFHEAFRPLLEARLTEQKKQQLALDPEGPEPTLLEPKCRLFVEGTEVNFNEHLFVQALIHSGLVEEQIDVRTIWGEDDEGRKFILGWCAFTWQAKDMKTLLELGQQQRSGILEGYSCCLLSRDPSFLEQDAKGAQSIFLHHCEYWAGKDRKGAYKMLKKMLSGNFEKEVEMPFTEAEAELWGRLGPNSHKLKYKNYKYGLGGAGVLGIFLVNEAELPIKVSKDAPLPDSLLPYAHAQVLKEMMSWVVDNPPLEYRAEKEKAEGEAADSAAKAAEAAARRAAQEAAQPQAAAPAAPEHAPSPGAVRQNPRRQSKDDANRKLSGQKRPAEEEEPLEELPSPSSSSKRKAKASSSCSKGKSLAFEDADLDAEACQAKNVAHEVKSVLRRLLLCTEKLGKHGDKSVPAAAVKSWQRALREVELEVKTVNKKLGEQ